MKPKQFKRATNAGKAPSIISVETPDVVKQALSRFKEVDVASEQVTYGDAIASSDRPTHTGAIVTTNNDVTSAVIIESSANDETLRVSFIPCNIPVAFSAEEALEFPYTSDSIEVSFGDDVVDRLYDTIHKTCMNAHNHYLDGLLDLDDQPQL